MIFNKTDNEWDFVSNEIKDRISSLTISCPECETILHSDEQYQCGTCNGGVSINISEWIEDTIKQKIKFLLKEYTNRIVENATAETKYELNGDEYGIVNKKSIQEQLPLMLKKLGI
jgi:hypothetical protein